MSCYKIKKERGKFRVYDNHTKKPALTETGWPIDKGGFKCIKKAEKVVIALNAHGYKH